MHARDRACVRLPDMDNEMEMDRASHGLTRRLQL